MESNDINICMIVHQIYSADARVRNYAEALAQCGVNVDVLCPFRAGAPISYMNDKIKVFQIPMARSPFLKRNPWIDYGLAFILYTFKLIQLVIKKRYQIIHVHNMPDFLIFTAFLPRLLGAKLILDIHDPMPEFYTAKFGARTSTKFLTIMKFEEKISSLFAHHILTANTNFRETLKGRGITEAKISVVNNIPDPNIFNRKKYQYQQNASKSVFTLVYPGTIAPRYGLDTAVRAIPHLISKIPNINLLIVGAGAQYSQELAQLADTLGVSTYVKINPPVPLDQVPELMATADVGIYPAIPDAHMSIAAPGKVLEYAVMGLPIISSRVRVVQQMFSESAILYHDPGNVEQFVNCVLALYENMELRKSLVENADKEFVRVHSWINEQRVYYEVINKLLPNQVKLICPDQDQTQTE